MTRLVFHELSEWAMHDEPVADDVVVCVVLNTPALLGVLEHVARGATGASIASRLAP